MSLSSFDTSTHHVDCKSAKDSSESRFAISLLFFVHCPLSVKSFNDLPLKSWFSCSGVPRSRRQERSHSVTPMSASRYHFAIAVLMASVKQSAY
ncbi:hypothetical protein [Allocoleopsis sp.]|uniref:hypothetical protein n=1 Tax=Allocoleopsis sp. TaxID=3088169 RepID=UPI002FCEDF17